MRKQQHCRRLGEFGKNLVVNKAALNTHQGTLGGYLIPPELRVGIDQELEEECVFMKYGWVQPMKSSQCWVGGLDIATSHATGASPLFGGMVLQPTIEGDDLPSTNPTFAQGNLVSKDLTGYIVISNQLVQDGGEPLGMYLDNAMRRLVRWTIERNCYVGTGIGEFKGIQYSPGTVVVSRTTTVTIVAADIASMFTSLLPACIHRCVWACSPTAFKKIAQLSQYSVNYSCGPKNGFVGSLLSRPLLITEHLPTVGTQGDILLFDPMMYVVGIREIEIAFSDQILFASNQSAYRIVLRGDGLTYARNTFKTQDGSTTVGCYVALSTL